MNVGNSFPDQDLLESCKYLAKQVLWKNGGNSTDVVEMLASRFYAIAEGHQDFVRTQRESDDVIAHAVRYIADVHAMPAYGTDLDWFTHTLGVLIELAVPNTLLNESAGSLLKDLQQGIAQSAASLPTSRESGRIDDDDARRLKFFEDAGCEYGAVSDLLDTVEKLYYGDPLNEEDERTVRVAALAAPLTRNAREDNK